MRDELLDILRKENVTDYDPDIDLDSLSTKELLGIYKLSELDYHYEILGGYHES